METPLLTSMPPTCSVYEPAEDSFLLLDALEQDLNSIKESSPNIALEVGCGSGVISCAIGKHCSCPIVFALDVNPEAVNLTMKNSLLNTLVDRRVQPILLEGSVLAGNCIRLPIFDIIVCNPPYVPTQMGEVPEEQSIGLLEKSWAGGADGNEFIIPFLKTVSSLLSEAGTLYLLLSDWNKPMELLNTVAIPNGLIGFELIKRRAGRERLSVWKFKKCT